MRLILTFFLLAISLSLSSARTRQRINVILNSTVRPLDQPDYTQSRKSPDDERYVERVEIHNQIGLDGKVRRIHSDEENKPGIRAYGLPKKHPQDYGVIERLHFGEDHIDDTLKSGRLVEAYGIPKNKVETNGFIDRLPLSSTDRESAKLESENGNVRIRRFVRTGSGNKVEEKVANEVEDMEAQDTKVFRPLFVYRQQVATRERRKHARNVAHRNHWHATYQPCYHRQGTH
ncbi:PREDICTED: uncharacterized protein LOC105569288 [Vollenhovia emeryi]|uniref:uncharacterized protein LOC105569288 n=1 Tax=Vollenhovia emeryi TaxID=411798 RepID=UPI0005F45060|nr:PREDICTED: uncharacterized protein LOC105569288 [Vollenhovia emeryi]